MAELLVYANDNGFWLVYPVNNGMVLHIPLHLPTAPGAVSNDEYNQALRRAILVAESPHPEDEGAIRLPMLDRGIWNKPRDKQLLAN